MLSHIIDGSDADNLGIAGIEKVFDSAGIQYAVRDGLQKSINEFNVVGGAAVVMNISNGEIISLFLFPILNAACSLQNSGKVFRKLWGLICPSALHFIRNPRGKLKESDATLKHECGKG